MKSTSRVLLILLALLLVFAANLYFPKKADTPCTITATAYFMNVGDADYNIIVTPEKTVVIDMGGEPDYSNYPELKSILKHVDTAVVTHQHQDHFLGFKGAVSDGIHIDHMVISQRRRSETSSSHYTLQRILNNLSANGTDYRFVDPETYNESMTLSSSVSLNFMPHQVTSSDINDESLVSMLKINGKNAVLYMADATAKTETQLMETYSNNELHASIIKVGHHGSAYSSSADFIRIVKPQYAIASAGVNIFTHKSAYHPARKTVDSFARVGAKFLSTNIDNSIKIEFLNSMMFEIHPDTPWKATIYKGRLD